ncbi:MAG: UDP-N-acetylmuramoyl-L-alanine--D-glutamate ligase [bacterium]
MSRAHILNTEHTRPAARPEQKRNGAGNSPYGRALVLGLGSSGVAAAKLLIGEGTQVTAVDAADKPDLREIAAELESAGAKVFLGRKTVPDGAFSVCVLSPGIPADSDWVRGVEARGTEVISELELGWRRCGSKTLAITGSNGKSTMAKLCSEALARAGASTVVAGNYGLPVSRVATERQKPDWLVLEVSSFQLERISQFRPDVGVVLNVLPNHLDRHGSMDVYLGLKAGILRNMGGDGTGVVPVDLREKIGGISPSLRRWSTFGGAGEADYAYVDGKVICRDRGGPGGGFGEVSFKGTFLDNEILGLTAAATVAAVQACGFEAGHVAAAARDFEQLPHRMQKVADIGGVEFVDNSKATNIAALSAALRVCKRPVRLIAGGRPKETDFASVKGILASRAVMVYLIGEAKFVLASAWQDTVHCKLCDNLAEAVGAAWRDARPGETILLAPGCTSFDQFRNFEERGERFSELVKSLSKDE